MRINYAWVIATSLFLAAAGTAHAQVSEVPEADNNGDFNTAIIQGNRGFYTNDWWVVVANSREDFLNCRDSPNGEIQQSIIPGAVVTAAFKGPVNLNNGQDANYDNDAIVMHSGRPWLRVVEYEHGWHPGRNFTPVGECYVRANLQYITPINRDASGVF